MSEYHGVVYTKKWVVDLMLDIAGYTIDKCLWHEKVIEPSCGHGSFLKEIVRRLLFTAKRDKVLDSEHLLYSIRSFDLDEEAVRISRSVVRDELLSYGFSFKEADYLSEHWVYCGDYLLSDSLTADYVIGNPPYLRSTEIPKENRDKYVSRISTMTKGCDLFVGFFQKGLESLNSNDGVLCYICADRWMQNQYGRYLREFISEKYHIDILIKMHDVDAFEVEVSAYPAIIRIDFGNDKIKYVDCSKTFSESSVSKLKSWLKSDYQDCTISDFSATLINQPRHDSIIPLSNPRSLRTIEHLTKRFPTLEESGVKLGIGLATGRDNVFIVKNPDVVEVDRILPMFNMRDWRRKRKTDDIWLVNPWRRDGELVDLSDYPKLQRYFEEHREEIEKRHVAKKNKKAWYRTIDKINWEIMGSPMLLFPDMSMQADPVYSDGTRYPCHNCYWLVSNTWDIKALGGLLMSDIAESFIDALAVKMRGGTKRFQAQYLRLIHVPDPRNLSDDLTKELRSAFENNDRIAANKAAALAYGLEEL